MEDGFFKNSQILALKIITVFRYLPEMDLGGYNDPYVNIYAKDSYARHYRKVAQTRIQHGARNPRWPEVFDYYFIKGAGQVK